MKTGELLAGSTFGSDDIKKTKTGIHVVFTTQSQILKNEVEKSYKSLKNHLAKQLEIAAERKKYKASGGTNADLSTYTT